MKLKKVWIPLLAVFLIAVISWSKSGNATPVGTAPVVRGTISETVLATGAVKPEESVELSFERTGRVASVPAKVGAHVNRGALLASLDSSAEYANVQNAKAKQSAEEARLAEMKKGGRPEEIAVAESDLANQTQILQNLYENSVTVMSDALNKTEKALNTDLDGIYESNTSSSISFLNTNSSAENIAEYGRIVANETLAALRADSKIISADASATITLQKNADRLVQIQNFLAVVNQVVDSAINVPAATLATYKANMSDARTNVANALRDIRNLIQDIADQKIAIQKSENQLTLKKIPSSPEAITIQQAVVDQAKASVLSAQAANAKNFINAPFAGTITEKNIKPGEISNTSQSAISMQSDAKFQLEVSIPEADIAKIKVGNRATTTLDTYGPNEEFAATVVAIDPAEKIVQGVATYKVTLNFLKPDLRIRSGMTANITIVTNERANVLSIPERAITTKNSVKKVTVQSADGKKSEERTVTTGLRGGNGQIEILSGLTEGETVVTFVKQ